MNQKRISPIKIEHIEITIHKPFEHVIAALEEVMSSTFEDMDALLRQLDTTNISWAQASHEIEKILGTSSFHIFNKIDHGHLLSLVGKPKKAVQYTIGNPLLAVQMTQHVAAVALYAPLKLAVYEENNTRTIIIYDSLSSCTAQFHNEEITRIAKHVDSLVEKLVNAAI